MIEIIYKEENEEINNNVIIKTPKNIKQIGSDDSTKKIYIEDYVMSFVKQMPKDPDDIKYGILLGEVKKGNGNTYIFINGGISVRESMDKTIEFNGDIWTEIYEDIKRYFNNMQIVGWFASYPFNDNLVFSTIRKNHLDNFAGNNKVFFGYDRTENEEAFYLYEANMLSKLDSYYIYYERNEDMQDYLIDHNISSDPEVIQLQPKRREGSYRAMIMGKKDKDKDKPLIKKEKFKFFKDAKEAVVFEKPLKESKVETKRFPRLASSLIVILLLVAVIGLMENYDQMKAVRTNITDMAKGLVGKDKNDIDKNIINEETEATVQIETVNGNVEPTKEEESQTETASIEPVTDAQRETEIQTTPITKPTETQKYHTVVEGDTLYKISRKLYNDTSQVQAIIGLNNLNSPDDIRVGQRLLLP